MAPDLVLTVSVEGLTRSYARDIADKSKERGGMRVTASGGLLSSPVLLIPDAHDLLADNADWNAETWAMEADGLQDLASTFAWLFGRIAGSMTVEATWAGEETTTVREVSRDEMLDIVRAGAIGTRTTYRVRPTVGYSAAESLELVAEIDVAAGVPEVGDGWRGLLDFGERWTEDDADLWGPKRGALPLDEPLIYDCEIRRDGHDARRVVIRLISLGDRRKVMKQGARFVLRDGLTARANGRLV